MIPSNIKALILDMDGVVWKADAPIGNLPEIFARIRERGLKFVFATNNGTKTPEEYQQKLADLGVDVEPWQVVTSALGIAFMLSQKYPQRDKDLHDRRRRNPRGAWRKKDLKSFQLKMQLKHKPL